MSKTKKILLTLFVIFLIAVSGVGILAFAFTQSMKADPDEEKKIQNQAEQYLEQNFKDDTSIFDVLYDNMGNWGIFEYAAQVRHEKYGTQFLVYSNTTTGEMEDTFIADKWKDDAEKEIKPYIEEKLGKSMISREMNEIVNSDNWEEIEGKTGDKIQLVVLFDDRIGKELNIDPNNPVSYKEFDVSPTIRITIPRKKQDTDDDTFNEIINSIQTDGVLKHGDVIVEYIKMGVFLEDEEWVKTF